ncbi:acetolactate synthase, regulatory subunit [Dispira parvispora]|uniref:Acetolactate synthase, regulatory subunit n=1 Tax=Dispira parvispora TaxID=1520584 RepID=A0A9W8ATN9_9FUNG|nr:acetolactate synthase, regulatory subunit [Dispira parvispora]
MACSVVFRRGPSLIHTFRTWTPRRSALGQYIVQSRFLSSTSPSLSNPSKFPNARNRFPVPRQPTIEEAVKHIVVNTPSASKPTTSPQLQVQPYVLNVLMQDEPGVLNRVTGIMAARGYNIDSLVVSKTEVPGLSRMTITILANPVVMQQAKRELEDLVPVWAVVDYSQSRMVEREVLLCKVSLVGPELAHGVDSFTPSSTSSGNGPNGMDGVTGEGQVTTGTSPEYADYLLRTHNTLQAVSELADLFRGHVVDVSAESVIVELCAKSSRVAAFLKLVKPFGILEAARSGKMVMGRSVSLSMFNEEAPEAAVEEEVNEIDPSRLPPG